MVIAVCVYSGIEPMLKLERTLKRMGHIVNTFYTDHYHVNSPYCMKKLDKCGIHRFRYKYEKKWKTQFLAYIDETKPDLIIYVNAPTAVIHPLDMDEISDHCKATKTKQVVWFVDTIFERDDLTAYYPHFDKIYVYEKQDVLFLRDNYNLEGEYVPVGFNDAYANTPVNKEKTYKYDVVFVGELHNRRVRLLNEVKKASLHYGWKLKVIMPWYEKRYFYKNILLWLKYPKLVNAMDKRFIDSSDVAHLYAQSKIGLNIHNERAKSCNPRTFEIMATGTFCLIDSRDDYDDIVVGRDLDAYTFDDAADCIEKIKLYLANDTVRERIARNGRSLVEKQYSMETSLRKIIGQEQ